MSQVHDCDLMRERTDQRQVMADKDHADIFFFLQTYQKLDDRLLYGNIQCRSCFITDQDLRFQRKCSCDTDPLTLSTTHVVRITVYKLFRKFYHAEKFSCFCISFVSFDLFVVHQRLCQNIPDLHLRVKRCHRILEDHLKVLAVFPGFFL